MSNPKPENKTQHVHILMSPSEVEAIDNWGFENRIRTKGEAIRRLCQIGMAHDQKIDALFNAALQGGVSYLNAMARLKELLSDAEASKAETAEAALHLFPELLEVLRQVVLHSTEISALARPYRTSEEFDKAVEQSDRMRAMMAEVGRGDLEKMVD